MDSYPESGVCLAEDDMALDLENFDMVGLQHLHMGILFHIFQVSGDWWTVYGQSCGQSDQFGDWTGAYDWVPCAHHRIVTVDGENWINNTTFCAGTDSVYQGDLIETSPSVYWISPGGNFSIVAHFR